MNPFVVFQGLDQTRSDFRSILFPGPLAEQRATHHHLIAVGNIRYHLGRAQLDTEPAICVFQREYQLIVVIVISDADDLATDPQFIDHRVDIWGHYDCPDPAIVRGISYCNCPILRLDVSIWQ